ncbi:hypothetical protein F5B21DRAFT_398911 [Xylaria acuta]|nr:hypothetical protein F5B21DRAFT_398911 [Xylaria acuta]
MSLHILAILGTLASGISAGAQAVTTQSLYGQCGGLSYTGPSRCPKSATCYSDATNPWYAQCVETPWDNGGGNPTSTVVTTTKTSKSTTTSKSTSTSKSTTVSKTTTTTKPTTTSKTSSTTTTGSVTTIITTLPPRTTTKTPGGKTTTVTLTPDDPFTEDRVRQDLGSPTTDPTQAADRNSSSRSRRQSGPGTTLQAGWYWVRAVAQPNYHKYLQTKPANAAGTAILESARTAGQYKIEDGQLIANTGGGAPPLYLYLHVEKPADFAQRTLATWFNVTRNEFGTFAWQGDALTWSAPEVKRQNLAAWLVCSSQALFINTGAYAYQTPAGCADQTIHYYNDAHANE